MLYVFLSTSHTEVDKRGINHFPTLYVLHSSEMSEEKSDKEWS